MTERKCRCGFDLSHPQITAEPKYSAWGWFLLLLGATPKPLRAVYRCKRCEQVLASTKDPTVLSRLT